MASSSRQKNYTTEEVLMQMFADEDSDDGKQSEVKSSSSGESSDGDFDAVENLNSNPAILTNQACLDPRDTILQEIIYFERYYTSRDIISESFYRSSFL